MVGKRGEQTIVQAMEKILLIITFMSTFLIFLYFYLKLQKKKRLMMSFFSFYSNRQKSYVKHILNQLKLVKRINNITKNTKSKISINQFFLLSLICGILGALIAYVATNYILMTILISICTCTIPYIQLANKERKRVKEVATQFAPMLKHMSNYLRSGNNLRQAIEKTSLITEGALGEILEEIVKKINGGEPISKAIDQAYEYVPLVEFKMFHILVRIHNDMGGDLAHSLENLANVINEKKILRSEIDSLTQETRASAYITAIIPALLYLAMRFTSPDYMNQLDELPFGKMGLVFSFGFIMLGVIAVKKMSNIKVDKAYR